MSTTPNQNAIEPSSEEGIAIPPTGRTIAAILKKSTKGRSTIHGDSYHLRVAMMIILRAYRMYQQDPAFFFTVALEVSEAGKFDDILYHYASPRLRPATTGTLFIQAKHKLNPSKRTPEAPEPSAPDQPANGVGAALPKPIADGFTIKEQALCTAGDATSTYSIPMYFMSFLEIDRHLTNDARYVLCTNAALDPTIERHFTVVNSQQDEAFQFCADIGATCYRIKRAWDKRKHPAHPAQPDNPFLKLIGTLRDTCLAKLGKVFAGAATIADHSIDFNDTLINTFASLIITCLQTEGAFKFRQDFSNAKQDCIAKFYKAYRTEYTKLYSKAKQHTNSSILPHEAEIKINRDSLASISNTAAGEELSAKFDQKVYEFYGKLLLVCNSANEEELRAQALALLPQCCNVEPGTAFEKIQGVLLDAMKSNMPLEFAFDLTFVKECFANLERDQNISNLKSASEDYIKQVTVQHRHIEVRPDRLKDSTLYTFLQDTSSSGLFVFSTSLELSVSSHILIQMLRSSFNYDTIFVTAKDRTTSVLLHELLLYLRDLNHATMKLITVLAKHEPDFIDELKQMAKYYCKKIVVLQQSAGSAPYGADALVRFFVNDLTPGSLAELWKQPERQLLGTVASLSHVVDATDELSFLLAVLDQCEDRASVIQHHNLNEHNYRQIERWYIHRQCVPYEQEIVWNHDDYSMSYSAMEIKHALASNENQPDPPAGDDSNGTVCVFLNDAGHGKTTYLSWLAWRLAASEPHLYVIKFIALEFSTDFERLLGEPSARTLPVTEIVRLLYRYTHLALFVASVNKRTVKETEAYRAAADRCAKRISVAGAGRRIVLDADATAGRIDLSPAELIELRLFRAKFNDRKLVLILDGFDEIAPHYKDVVLGCFARFAQLDGVRSLYLSSRPYGLEADLRQTFDRCQLYKLAPFTKCNIVFSLHSFLLRKLEGYECTDTAISMDMVRELYDSLFFRLQDIVTVPLLLYMVLTVLLPDIRQRVSENVRIKASLMRSARLAEIELVERFVDRKLQISHIDKTGSTDSAGKTPKAIINASQLNRKAKKDHALLAMHVLFDGRARAKLLSGKEQKRAGLLLMEVNEGDEKAGLVLGVRNGVPQFLHRIFAEYFTAHWLYRNLAHVRQDDALFQSRPYWSASFAKTRHFLDLMIVRDSERCDLHWALVNGFNAQVVEVLHRDPDAIASTDREGRIPLHVVQYVDNETVLQATPRELIDLPDKLYGWSALDYAFALDDDQWVCAILSKGATVNEDTLVRQLCANDTDELWQQIIQYVYWLERYASETDAAHRLAVRMVGYMRSVRGIDMYAPVPALDAGMSMLEFCVAKSNHLVLHQLLVQAGESVNTLDGRIVDRLLQLSLDKQAYRVTVYLLEHNRSLLAQLEDSKALVGCAKVAATIDHVPLFKAIFHELCVRHEVKCCREEDIPVQVKIPNGNGKKYVNIPFVNHCCSGSNELAHQYSRFDKDDAFDVECLLAQALSVGSLPIARYILEKTGMLVTNAVIGQLFKLLSLLGRSCHVKSLPAYQYLLSNSLDLYSVDQDGHNLLHMILLDGCVYMLPCLIIIGFIPTQMQSLYYQLLSRRTENRAANIFVCLYRIAHVDSFEPLDATGESIFDIAITKHRFKVAVALVHAKHGKLTDAEKESVLMDLLTRMLSKHAANRVLNFVQNFSYKLNHSNAGDYSMWQPVYWSIRKRIPIV